MNKSFYRTYTAQVLLVALSFLFCTFCFVCAQAQTSEERETGVRLDLLPDSELRIVNKDGAINVEVWKENYVFVNATPDDAKGNLPIHIERTARGLKIDVVGRDMQAANARLLPASMKQNATPIELQVRVPARSRVEIVTTNGDVRVHGLTTYLNARTTTGNVSIDVPTSSNADIYAQSSQGSIISTLASLLNDNDASRANEKIFQAKFGNGSEKVRLISDSGRITLTPLQSIAARDDKKDDKKTDDRTLTANANPSSSDDAVTATSSAPRTPPKLIGVQGQRTRARKVGDVAQEVGENEVVRVDTNLVTLNFGVVDRASNRAVSGLARGDFKLYEDGVEQEVVNFESAAAPFDLVLLLDVSGSTTKVFELVRTAARRFVDVSRPQDRIAIITFSSDMNIVSPLTTDRAMLRSAIAAMKPPKGDTKLYDAVAFSMKTLSEAKDPLRRRAIVLVSDGLDSTLPNVTGTGSKMKYDDLRRAVQEYDGQLYTMWVDTTYEAFSPDDIQPETFDLGHDRMKELADTGGGVFYEVDRYEDLAGASERVIEDLGTIYNLSYRPSNKTHDGSWRSVRVTLPTRPQTVARGKSGYYAR